MQTISSFGGLFQPIYISHVRELPKLIFTPQFRMLQGLFFGGFGTKEILCDRVTPIKSSKNSTTDKIVTFFKNNFFQIHGLLFLSSGISGIASIFSQHKELLLKLEFSSFLSACFLALLHNLKEFNEASNERIKKSAALGIISNFNYLLWGAFTALEFSTAFAVIFCCLGLFAGGAKIVLDLYTQYCTL